MKYTISIEGTSWYISDIDKKQLNRTLDALIERGYSPINVTVEELESEKPKDSYRFGDYNPSVSARNYTGRGGHETWGTQR